MLTWPPVSLPNFDTQARQDCSDVILIYCSWVLSQEKNRLEFAWLQEIWHVTTVSCCLFPISLLEAADRCMTRLSSLLGWFDWWSIMFLSPLSSGCSRPSRKSLLTCQLLQGKAHVFPSRYILTRQRILKLVRIKSWEKILSKRMHQCELMVLAWLQKSPPKTLIWTNNFMGREALVPYHGVERIYGHSELPVMLGPSFHDHFAFVSNKCCHPSSRYCVFHNRLCVALGSVRACMHATCLSRYITYTFACKHHLVSSKNF